MPVIQDIKKRYQNGEPLSVISRELGVDRKTVRKYAQQTDFSPELPVRKKRKSKLDACDEIIRGYLEEDRKTWKKQRHTAVRIYERLRDEHGYTGSYETVQKRVKAIRRELKQTRQSNDKENVYLPLEWVPGTMQVDFGTDAVPVSSKCILRVLPRMGRRALKFQEKGRSRSVYRCR